MQKTRSAPAHSNALCAGSRKHRKREGARADDIERSSVVLTSLFVEIGTECTCATGLPLGIQRMDFITSIRTRIYECLVNGP